MMFNIFKSKKISSPVSNSQIKVVTKNFLLLIYIFLGLFFVLGSGLGYLAWDNHKKYEEQKQVVEAKSNCPICPEVKSPVQAEVVPEAQAAPVAEQPVATTPAVTKKPTKKATTSARTTTTVNNSQQTAVTETSSSTPTSTQPAEQTQEEVIPPPPPPAD